MIRRFVRSVLLILLAMVIVKALPDVARYLKMREM
jgi:hypothetical protein